MGILVTACEVASSYERILGLDWQLIQDGILQGINIFIMFFALSYLLFNPVRTMLTKRREKIAGDLETAEREKTDAIALKEDYENRIKNIDKEAEEILSAARKKAVKREAEIIAEAKEEAARIIARADNEIALEKKKALDGMKQEMITIAAMMAKKAVASSMDIRIQDALVEQTLNEIGDETWRS